jgi:hypothetical protein
MAVPSRPFNKSSTGVPAPELQRQIAEQTAAFLAGGGEIQRIPRGVSGQPKLGGPQFTVTQAGAKPA